MSVSALRLVARPTGTAPLRARPAKAGNRARTAPRASGKDEEESAGGIDYASLERRVLNLKKQELVGHTGHLPVVVLDATLPSPLQCRFGRSHPPQQACTSLLTDRVTDAEQESVRAGLLGMR